MKLITFILCFLPLSLLSQTNAGEAFRVGAAVRVITPDPLLPVSGGVGVPKDATEKKGELYVRAMVFEKGDTRIAIVNVDNLGWPSALGDHSRALIKGIPADMD